MRRLVAILSGYIVACLMVAAVFTYWRGGEGPVEIGNVLGAFWATTLLAALPGYAATRAGMSAFGLTGLPAFVVMGALNGIFAAMLMAGLAWPFPVIGAFAGLTAGLTECFLNKGPSLRRQKVE